MLGLPLSITVFSFFRWMFTFFLVIHVVTNWSEVEKIVDNCDILSTKPVITGTCNVQETALALLFFVRKSISLSVTSVFDTVKFAVFVTKNTASIFRIRFEE